MAAVLSGPQSSGEVAAEEGRGEQLALSGGGGRSQEGQVYLDHIHRTRWRTL